MHQLMQPKVWLKYILPIIIFIIFLSCGIWLWSSHFAPWEYSYSNSEYTVNYTFYDRTYSWTQVYNDDRTTRTGNGTFDIYSAPDGKYMWLTGRIHYADGDYVKAFTKTSAHSLATTDEASYHHHVDVTYTCTKALVFEVFCGLIISITGLYLIVQFYFYYKKASKNAQTKVQLTNSNNEDKSDLN